MFGAAPGEGEDQTARSRQSHVTNCRTPITPDQQEQLLRRLNPVEPPAAAAYDLTVNSVRVPHQAFSQLDSQPHHIPPPVYPDHGPAFTHSVFSDASSSNSQSPVPLPSPNAAQDYPSKVWPGASLPKPAQAWGARPPQIVMQQVRSREVHRPRAETATVPVEPARAPAGPAAAVRDNTINYTSSVQSYMIQRNSNVSGQYRTDGHSVQLELRNSEQVPSQMRVSYTHMHGSSTYQNNGSAMQMNQTALYALQ